MAKCVIADDSRIIRMLLSKIMANLNFEVIEAEDGEEVVEMVELNEPAVVIMTGVCRFWTVSTRFIKYAASKKSNSRKSCSVLRLSTSTKNPRGAGRRCRRLYNETL